MRKWFGERVLSPYLSGVTNVSGQALVERLAAGTNWAIEVEEGKRTKIEENGNLVLARELGERHDLISVSEAGLLFGLALLGRTQPELLRWRNWALKFSWAFPAFTLLIVIFASLAGNAGRALPFAFLGLGIGSVVGFLAAWVEWQAAGITGRLLKDRAVLSREDDRIAVAKSMRGLAARRCVPGMLQMLFPEARRAKITNEARDSH